VALRIYQIKKELFEQLSGAISRQSPIHFLYNERQRSVNPYKLINNNGIWYLLADDNAELKTYTFSKIKQMKWDFKIHFSPKKEFLNQIEKNDVNWISKDFIEVTLEIDTKAKEYFFRKETLANKRIIEENENHIIVSTNIAYDDEIIHLVKYWIPYIKIKSPQYLQEKLSKILNEYLQTT
jgi:predicted DNA-binding transcriptional regulator YafY